MKVSPADNLREKDTSKTIDKTKRKRNGKKGREFGRRRRRNTSVDESSNETN
jgi:hypothetical protein